MDDGDLDGAAVSIAPPLFYLGGVLAGVFLHALVYPFDLGFSMADRIGAGAIAAIAGVVLVTGAIGLFRRTGQDPKPWKPTPEIVSTGVYRLTRNPMYLGMAFLQMAIGFGLSNGWIVVLVPAVLAVVHVLVVRREESYLESKFGDEYLRYKAAVRRWV